MIIKMNKTAVITCIQDQSDEEGMVVCLFRKYIPNWNNVIQINGFPQITLKTAHEITTLLFNEGKKKELNVQKISLLWMNYGFGTLHAKELNLQDWDLYVDEKNITYKGDQNASI